MHLRMSASLDAESWCFMGTVGEVLDMVLEDGWLVVCSVLSLMLFVGSVLSLMLLVCSVLSLMFF